MPAFYRNFYFKAPRFQIEHSRDYILHIRLRPNQVTYGIISGSQRIEMIVQLDTTATLAFGPLLQLAIQEDPLLSQPFREVHITLPAVAFTPVPILSAAYAGMEEIHESSGGGYIYHPGTRTHTESVVDLGVHFAMDFVEEDLEALFQLFPAAQVRCEEMVTALLARHVSQYHPNLILAGISQRNVTIAVFHRQNLAFLNRFSWESPQDILYFLQLSHHAAGDTTPPYILLMGDLDTRKDPFRTVQKHIPGIRLLGNEADARFDDPETIVPKYRFADLAM